MTRVHVICEGQTEEMFVNEVLSEALGRKGVYLLPSLLGKPGHKGGNLRVERVITDVRNRLLGDTTAYCTTFFDFYGLPDDFPGKTEARARNGSRDKAECLLQAFLGELKQVVDGNHLRRFIPYVQMHEFEGLLFSDPNAFACGLNIDALARSFGSIRNAFNSPEDINDGATTSPSKRIKKLFAAYDKPLHGSLAAIEIGMDAIRRECPLFDEWLKRLESLSQEHGACPPTPD